MPLAFILIVLGAIFVLGGIKNYSISDLILGRVVNKPNKGGGGTDTSTPTTTTTNVQGFTSPVTLEAKYEGIDQGVDYSQSTPYVAIGEGTVEKIATGWHGGTGEAVYYRLLHPVTVNGRTYSEAYVAEVTPLVKAGDKLHAGQPIGSAGSAEVGFLINGEPTPLVGGYNFGHPGATQPSQAGRDFFDFIRSLLLTQH